MSTKIYNGYIVKGYPGIKGLTNFCEKVKNTIAPIREKEIHKTIIKFLCTTYDYNNNGLLIPYELENLNKKELKHPYIKLIRYLDNLQNKFNVKKTGNSLFYFGFSVCFVPLRNKLICLMYSDNQEFVKAWENIEGVEDYHYQNQTDPPSIDEVTTRQWNQRRKDWNEIFSDSVSSYEMGLNFSPFESYSYSIMGTTYQKSDDILKLQPTIKERASTVAFEILFNEFYTKNQENNKNDFSLYFKYADFLKTNEGKLKKESLINDLCKNISPITNEDLFLNKINLNYSKN